MLNSARNIDSYRPEACFADLRSVKEVLEKYRHWLGADFEITDYLHHLGWFLFVEEEEDFAKSVCRAMLMKRNLPEQYIWTIEHEVLIEATPPIDALMLEYDRLKALYPDDLQAARGLIIADTLFVVHLQWLHAESSFVLDVRKQLKASMS